MRENRFPVDWPLSPVSGVAWRGVAVRLHVVSVLVCRRCAVLYLTLLEVDLDLVGRRGKAKATRCQCFPPIADKNVVH